jgi:sensor histidine kinase regulating citrate/malate metabolism
LAAIENLADGLLIVTRTGEVLHKNRCAHKLLQILNQNYQTLKAVPKIIWQACQTLVNGQEARIFAPDRHLVLEDEIDVQAQGRIRMRVQWFNWKPRIASW